MEDLFVRLLLITGETFGFALRTGCVILGSLAMVYFTYWLGIQRGQFLARLDRLCRRLRQNETAYGGNSTILNEASPENAAILSSQPVMHHKLRVMYDLFPYSGISNTDPELTFDHGCRSGFRSGFDAGVLCGYKQAYRDSLVCHYLEEGESLYDYAITPRVHYAWFAKKWYALLAVSRASNGHESATLCHLDTTTSKWAAARGRAFSVPASHIAVVMLVPHLVDPNYLGIVPGDNPDEFNLVDDT